MVEARAGGDETTTTAVEQKAARKGTTATASRKPSQEQPDHADERADDEGEEHGPPRAAEDDGEPGGGQGVAEHPRQRCPADGCPAGCCGRRAGSRRGRSHPARARGPGGSRPGGLAERELDALGVHDGGGSGRGLADDDERGQHPDRQPSPTPAASRVFSRADRTSVTELPASSRRAPSVPSNMPTGTVSPSMTSTWASGAPEGVPEVRQRTPDPDHQVSVTSRGSPARHSRRHRG